jgi:hydrogenase maturation factor
MSEGALVYAGRILEIREAREGRVGRVSVRGARKEVALDLVPGARPGDTVLVHAGVALSLVEDAGDALERKGAGGL